MARCWRSRPSSIRNGARARLPATRCARPTRPRRRSGCSNRSGSTSVCNASACEPSREIPYDVLHPGFWNREAGPDFREAVVQFGSDRAVVGDVEIDLHPAAWRGHRHENNPAYRRVILHVVWDGDSPAVSALPTLALKSSLDAPLRELRWWLGTEPGWPDILAGQCAAPLRAVSEPGLSSLLQQAALVRLQGKGDALAARARQAGWEQSLWEGLFGALGFKHNVWPMRRMAEVLPARGFERIQKSRRRFSAAGPASGGERSSAVRTDSGSHWHRSVFAAHLGSVVARERAI